jgi:pimeloyl-ACP methyl ester carboxylesterase
MAVRTASGPASFGIGSAIIGAAKAVTDRLRKAGSALVVDPLADLARPWVGFFLGDVFTYLYHNDLREQIRAEVREKLLAAHAGRAAGEKLVVIGHSMGGVILVDMLCSPTAAGLPADLKVDALLTVGSQPGLFQALGLFVPISATRIPKPACVGTWHNVFDPIDPLAFRADPIFDDVTDFKFDSITGLASAHTTYFLRPQFYARARKRLKDCGAIA